MPLRYITRIVLLFFTAVSGLAAQEEMYVYFGDVHVHSNLSTDAYVTGNQTVTPDMAYKFARGMPIVHPTTRAKIRIDRPLDFLAVTDHAINLGIDVMLKNEHELLQGTEWGRRLIDMAKGDSWDGFMRNAPTGEDRAVLMKDVFSAEIRQAAWAMEIEAAEENYHPGKFTTLIGWEWTVVGEGWKNLHRCVLTDVGGDAARRFIPLSNNESSRPEELWDWLERTNADTGIDFVAIPHNSNISGGLMFDLVDSNGLPVNSEYARTRMRWEPVIEVTQTKGTSEVHPDLAPTDEFADYEIRRKLLIGTPTPADEGDYARSALLRGLTIQHSAGVNPYKFGMIGSTDNHLGVTTVDESNFLGKLAVDALPADRAAEQRPIFPAWEMSASGLAAVWAPENTREAIFAAFKRKEVYATTGTRIRLRMFGGYRFHPRDARANDIGEVGYSKGVPMGADLAKAPRGRAPAFLIHAARDPEGANLDRLQVIKGWLDKDGNPRQKIYEVAWSGIREQDAEGKLPPVGNTVDTSTGLYSNTIGSPQLAVVWEDPDFEPDQIAFYYTRVLEIPTPRHSVFDALALGIDVSETGQPATLQERAYSSPIWYSP